MAEKLSNLDLKARLKNANEQSKQEFINLPDGNYHMLLKSVEYGKSKAGDKMVTHVCQVLNGPDAGKTHRFFGMIDTDFSLVMMLKHWRTLGYDTDLIVDDASISDACEALTKKQISFSCDLFTKTANDGKEYQNMKINFMVGEDTKVSKPAAGKPAAAKTAPVSKPKVDEVAEPEPEPEADPEPEAEPEPEPEADADVDVEVGDTVKFTYRGEEFEGVVTLTDEEAGTMKVKSGKLTYPIKGEAVTALVAKKAK